VRRGAKTHGKAKLRQTACQTGPAHLSNYYAYKLPPIPTNPTWLPPASQPAPPAPCLPNRAGRPPPSQPSPAAPSLPDAGGSLLPPPAPVAPSSPSPRRRLPPLPPPLPRAYSTAQRCVVVPPSPGATQDPMAVEARRRPRLGAAAAAPRPWCGARFGIPSPRRPPRGGPLEPHPRPLPSRDLPEIQCEKVSITRASICGISSLVELSWRFFRCNLKIG
jgi:hypothetical protein